DQNGRTVTAADLGGQVWVADFMFTRCPSICPLLTEKLARVEGARKVSFSVDPGYDTPPVLAAYAEAHHAPWTFLPGATDAVARGFKMGLEGTDHDTHFVLVDADRKVRGYYDSSDDEALARLKADIEKINPRRSHP